MSAESVTRSVLKAALARLRRQKNSIVDDLEFRLGVDHAGDPATFITVILKDPRGRDYEWSDVEHIERPIREALLRRVPSHFPFVGFSLVSERLEVADADAAF